MNTDKRKDTSLRWLNRGMSLVEMIIVMVILMAVASALLWMLITGKKMHQSSKNRAANRQDIQIITSRIADELKDSDVNSVSTVIITAATPPNLPRVRAISFLSAYPRANDASGDRSMQTDSNGVPIWQKYVIYYIPQDNTTRLLRKEVTITATTDASKISNLSDRLTGDGQLISSSMAFELDTQGLNIYTLPRFYFAYSASESSATLNVMVRSLNRNGKFDEQSKMTKMYLLN